MSPPPRLLLALDMDGTLLRDDKTVAEVDAYAIRGAAQHGIAVTLATGRLITGALPTARQLGLDVPLICADGSVLIDPTTGTTLERRSIAIAHATQALTALLSHDLIPFVFSAHAIHCEASGGKLRAVVDTWTDDLVIHQSLHAADAWKSPEGVAVTVGIGDRDAVERASAHLRHVHGDTLDTVHFGLRGMTIWAVRSLARGCDKGDMLERLALRMNIPRAQVAAVGDWFNDLGMFKYAGRSFAMGQAPEAVQLAATDQMRATSTTGGGIAEAIAALLAT